MIPVMLARSLPALPVRLALAAPASRALVSKKAVTTTT
jgi:hypothetical protein